MCLYQELMNQEQEQLNILDVDTFQKPQYNIIYYNIGKFTKWAHGGSKLALIWGLEESTEVMAVGMHLRK